MSVLMRSGSTPRPTPSATLPDPKVSMNPSIPLGARACSRSDNPAPYWAGRIPSEVSRSTLVSPGCRLTAATDAHAVAPAPAIVAAASHDRPGGFGATRSIPSPTYSACACRGANPTTSSPAANSSTPEPISATYPAKSLPCPPESGPARYRRNALREYRSHPDWWPRSPQPPPRAPDSLQGGERRPPRGPPARRNG